MSSFTIDKVNYIKAAGIIAGISEASNAAPYGSKHIWLYDYETQRNATAEDYYRRFVECFEMNALSVYEQYEKRYDLYTDGADYKKEFNTAIRTGKKLYKENGEKLKNAIMEIRHFFHSAIYQTEKYEYMFKMQFYFYGVMEQLSQFLYDYEPESWGELKISA